jgi:hypothetical protein
MMSSMKHHHAQVTVRRYGCLKLIGFGLALAIVGCLRVRAGVEIVTHWTGQPMFSWGLISGGGFCILLALIPMSWIAAAAATDSKAERRR